MLYSGIFRLKFGKTIWLLEEKKPSNLRPKGLSWDIFALQFWKTIVIFEISFRICPNAKVCAKQKLQT